MIALSLFKGDEWSELGERNGGVAFKCSSSLFEELPQSYDAANSVCSAIDMLRKEK